MKKTNRILALVLCVLMALSALPGWAQEISAAEAVQELAVEAIAIAEPEATEEAPDLSVEEQLPAAEPSTTGEAPAVEDSATEEEPAAEETIAPEGDADTTAPEAGVEVQRLTVDAPETLRGGKSAKLKLKLDGESLSYSKVKWVLEPNDKAIATIKEGKLSVQAIAEAQTLRLTAVLKSDESVQASVEIALVPAVKKVQLSASEKIIDLGGESPTLQLAAECSPAGASQRVKWSSSSKKIATVDENGLVTALKPGKVTITAKAADGSEKSAKLSLQVVNAVRGLEISGATEMAAGKSVKLRASFEPANATNKKLKWSLDCPKTIASISGGTVTAKKVKAIQTITVTATSIENPEIAASHEITIRPAVGKVNISAPGKRIDLGDGGQMQLTGSCTPEGASQQLKWSSSNRKIATVDESGLVTALKPGKVTITAKAADGSGRSAKISLSVTHALRAIAIEGPDSVAAGKSVKLSISATPTGATNKQVIWKLDCPKTVATFSEGRLSVKKNAPAQNITITAVSKENPEITATHVIAICPAVGAVEISAPEKRIDLNGSATLQLSATCQPAEASQAVSWSSSNREIATVDASGLVTALKAGKVTITAKATDGSGKSASLALVVYRSVQDIRIEGKQEIIGGLDLSLKASLSPANATNKGIAWSVDCPASVATIDDGELRTHPVRVNITVTVTAASVENPEIFATHRVTITVNPGDAVAMKVAEVVSKCCKPGMSDYEMVKALHDWLIYNANYDYTYTYFHADGVLLYGKGVCQSYAEAYEKLLDAAGISNKFVTGSADNGTGSVSHAWNMVKLDGDWYHVDCTWDDPNEGGWECHDYFCVPDFIMEIDHRWGSGYPKCTATKYTLTMNQSDGCFSNMAELEAIFAAFSAGKNRADLYYTGTEPLRISEVLAWCNRQPFGNMVSSITVGGHQLVIELFPGATFPGR